MTSLKESLISDKEKLTDIAARKKKLLKKIEISKKENEKIVKELTLNDHAIDNINEELKNLDEIKKTKEELFSDKTTKFESSTKNFNLISNLRRFGNMENIKKRTTGPLRALIAVFNTFKEALDSYRFKLDTEEKDLEVCVQELNQSLINTLKKEDEKKELTIVNEKLKSNLVQTNQEVEDLQKNLDKLNLLEKQQTKKLISLQQKIENHEKLIDSLTGIDHQIQKIDTRINELEKFKIDLDHTETHKTASSVNANIQLKPSRSDVHSKPSTSVDTSTLSASSKTSKAKKRTLTSSKLKQLATTVLKNDKKTQTRSHSDVHEPEPIFENFTYPQLRSTTNAEFGRHITYSYENKGVVYGKDVIERNTVIKDLKDSLEKKIKFLKKELADLKSEGKNGPDTKVKIDHLMHEIKLHENTLKNAQKTSGEFIGSQFFRDELGTIVKQSKNQSDYNTRLNSVCLGAPVNFRYQKFEGGNKNVGFFRVGVMTDLRNGFTHLKELKEIKKELTKNSSSPILKKKLEELKAKEKNLSSSPTESNAAALLAVRYAINQLQSENLDNTIEERRHILNNQMLQLVQGQVEKNLKKIQSDTNQTSLSVTHLGLLNRTTDTVDATGWSHNEAAEMEDMSEIFVEFAGKTLIFDGQGPFIDSDGHIHLAQKIEDSSKGIKRLTLETDFVNISVQGHTKNDGIQAEINKNNMTKLLKTAEKKVLNNPHNLEYKQGFTLLSKVAKDLEQGKSSYKLAEKFSIALLYLDEPLSIGCLSAKDRTGYVGGRAVLHFVKNNIMAHPNFKAKQPSLGLSKQENIETQVKKKKIAKKQKKLVKKFNKQVVSESSSGAQVIYDNTGIKIYKCSALTLPGLPQADRIMYLAKQAAIAT